MKDLQWFRKHNIAIAQRGEEEEEPWNCAECMCSPFLGYVRLSFAQHHKAPKHHIVWRQRHIAP